MMCVLRNFPADVTLVKLECDVCRCHSVTRQAVGPAHLAIVQLRLRGMVRRRFGWRRAMMMRPGDDEPMCADLCSECAVSRPRPWKS